MRVYLKKWWQLLSPLFLLGSMVLVSLIWELADWGSHAGASSQSEPAPAEAAAEPATPSNAELRERVRKRMEQIARSDAESSEGQKGPQPSSEDVASLLNLLKERQALLDEKEAGLKTRARELDERQSMLQKQLNRYEKTLAELRKQLRSLESSGEGKMAVFRQMYEKMEPKRAANIMNGLPVETSTQVLSGMKQQQAAEILSKMDPAKARAITQRGLSSTGSPGLGQSSGN